MIKGNIKNAAAYAALHPAFAEAFAFLKTVTADTATGRHDIDGDALYANVQKYDSKDPAVCKPENHHRYIDIQYMVSGREKILVTDVTNGMEVADAYHEDSDYELFAPVGGMTELYMTEGDFAILFPDEAHTPGLRYDGVTAEPVGKVVVKVRVE